MSNYYIMVHYAILEVGAHGHNHKQVLYADYRTEDIPSIGAWSTALKTCLPIGEQLHVIDVNIQ